MFSTSASWRKHRSFWREFPYLWGVFQDWTGTRTGGTQVIKVKRLDREALLQIVNPEEHKVFQHNVEKLDHCWKDWLYAVQLEGTQALVDALYCYPDGVAYSGSRALPSTEAGTDALIIIQHAPGHRNGDGLQTTPDEDRITIYKPPFGNSINELVMQEWKKLCRVRALPVVSGI
ncbi:MAG: hypothetical protein HYT22_00160 [Candidatus Niyogibacteria bacterium]|nr:hypothetical protein [Candidatus Niyogibacteria bacterium]